MTIRLIAGLGNPGKKYIDTRHNIGFLFIDNLIQNSKFLYQSRFEALVTSISFDKKTIFLLKPQTYMNHSGRSIQALMSFYNIYPEHVLIVHDELYLPDGKVKIKKGGSSGGHNGLNNITAQLGTQHYWRLRLGINHPRNLGKKENIAQFVLQSPSQEEKLKINVAIKKSLEIIPLLCTGNFEKSMQLLHTITPK